MIEYRQSPHVARFYAVLAELDLGRDAANIYQPKRAPAVWAPALRTAYLAADGRLLAQVLPLITQDAADLRAWLANPRGQLNDAKGRVLCDCLRTAFEQADATFGPAEPDSSTRALVDTLHRALWAGRARPRLIVEDAPALRVPPFTHGRAVSLGEHQRVAVAFEAGGEQVAIQILHETTHAVTDAEVSHAASRSTRVGDAGYDAHMAIERAAVERGQMLIDAHAPSLKQAYVRWRARYAI